MTCGCQRGHCVGPFVPGGRIAASSSRDRARSPALPGPPDRHAGWGKFRLGGGRYSVVLLRRGISRRPAPTAQYPRPFDEAGQILARAAARITARA